VSPSECPCSNCSMRAWTFAAMASLAVCCFGCGCLGFWVNGTTVFAVVIAMVFMGVSSLAVAVAFHAMRGMYLHAERLLAKAGRQGAREGYLPSGAKRRTSEAKVCTSAARKTAGNPCAAPGQSPQRGLVSLFALVRAPNFQGGRCGKEHPAEVGSGEPQDRSAGGGLLPPITLES
jgi:hypothetical protein